MTPNDERTLSVLLPNLDNEQLAAARERLRAYALLAAEIGAALTVPKSSGNVQVGQVDPSNFTTFG
jgi:hypothetical protein